MEITKKETKALFDSRSDSFTRDAVLEYIDKNKGIAPDVVTGWLEGWGLPSAGIQKEIFFCLKNMLPIDFPEQVKPVEVQTKVPKVAKSKLVVKKPNSPLIQGAANSWRDDSVFKKMMEDLRSKKVIL